MVFSFNTAILYEGNRAYFEIPFNVWDETGLKGNIPCKIVLNEITFECKLVPKGNGRYLIPIVKNVLSKLEQLDEYSVCMEPINTLTRINNNSPYSKENPIRKIDSIEVIPTRDGYCGQRCIAIITGLPLEDVINLMGKEQASWSKILEALDYYGISYSSKAVYTRGKECELPECCIVNNDNRFLLWYKGTYCGVTDVDYKKTVNYIEIIIK